MIENPPDGSSSGRARSAPSSRTGCGKRRPGSLSPARTALSTTPTPSSPRSVRRAVLLLPARTDAERQPTSRSGAKTNTPTDREPARWPKSHDDPPLGRGRRRLGGDRRADARDGLRPGTDLGGLGWYLGIWVTMTTAMMLPSAAPAAGHVARSGPTRAGPPRCSLSSGTSRLDGYGLAAYAVFRS